MHFKSIAIIEPFTPSIDDDEINLLKSRIDDYKNGRYGYTLIHLQGAARENFINGNVKACEMMLNPFINSVVTKLGDMMDNYDVDNETTFISYEDEIKHEFEDPRERYFINLPNGTIIPEFESYEFSVRNGKLYHYHFRKHCAKNIKRDKTAKKAKLLFTTTKKAYGNINRYRRMVADLEYYYDDQTHEYGMYENPYGVFDWFCIGGRWPDPLLVKKDATPTLHTIEYQPSPLGWIDDEHPETNAPEGCKWATAAKVKDIDWNAMYNHQISVLEDTYDQFIAYINKGELNLSEYTQDGILFRKSEYIQDGVLFRHNQPIFDSSDTKEEYVNKNIDRYFTKNKKYARINSVFTANEFISFTDDENDEAYEKLINSLDPDTVIVGIDYHI